MDEKPVRLLQISDTHLLTDPQGVLLGVPTRQSFQAVVDKIAKEEAAQIDFILHSGDMSQDGSEQSYAYVAEAFKPLLVPVYFAPGNHDDPKVMTSFFPRENMSIHRHIILKHWHIILLNSHKNGAVAGSLDVAQINYLQHCLDAYPEHRAIIMFHHHPLSVGTTWLSDIGLLNADQLWELVAHHANVHTILFGHVHQEFSEMKNGIHCYGVPSTCIQFKPKQTQFVLDKIPPGYRWINLHADGRLETGIKRIAEYIGNFDEKATGY